MKADINKCDVTINKKRLMSILDMFLKDQLLNDTIVQLLQGSVKELDKSCLGCGKSIGLPQSNPVSPVLANLYLNEFDYFVEHLKKEFDKSNAKLKVTSDGSKAV